MPAYPFDPNQLAFDDTASSNANRVTGETFTITDAASRVYVPTGGAFYTKDLQLYRNDNNTLLQPGVHYKAIHLVKEATLQTKKEVVACIFVHNENVTGEIRMNYRAVGGIYINLYTAVQELIAEYGLPTAGQVAWGHVIGAPVQFPPVEHMHSIRALFGTDEMVAILEGIRIALLEGDRHVQQMIYQYIDTVIANETVSQEQFALLNTAIAQAIADHVSSSSAHTKAAVGLGNVPNYPVATTAQAQAGTHNASLMTPALTLALATALINKSFVGLGNVPNFGVASAVQAVDVTNDTTLMTPQRVSQALTAMANASLVGLGNVGNYAVASDAEAIAGTANDKYETPRSARLTASALFAQREGVGEDPDLCIEPIFKAFRSAFPASLPGTASNEGFTIFNIWNKTLTHLMAVGSERMQLAFGSNTATKGIYRRYYNSGGWQSWETVVDKTAVGLGNLENYPVATDLEAFNGSANNRYTTALRAKQTAFGALRHVGSVTNVNPNTLVVPVAMCQHDNCPTGTTGNASGHVFIVATTFKPTTADEINATTQDRTQIAYGQNVAGIYRRSYASSSWSAWVRLDAEQVELGSLNLNTLTTPGRYMQSNSANITQANGYPFNNTATINGTTEYVVQLGTLIIEKYSIYTRQTYQARMPGGVEVEWVRHFDTGSWSAWKMRGTSSILYSKNFQTVGSGTFNVGSLPAVFPEAVLWIRVWAGGGSGGVAISANQTALAGGGSGGGYVDIMIPLSKLAQNASFSLNVGVGGPAASITMTSGNVGFSYGNDGSDSYVTFVHSSGGNVTIRAKGGLGGIATNTTVGLQTGQPGGKAYVNEVLVNDAAYYGGDSTALADSGSILVGILMRAIHGGSPGGDATRKDGTSNYTSDSTSMRGRTINGGTGGTATQTNNANATAAAGGAKGGGGGGAMVYSHSGSTHTATSGKGGDGWIEFNVIDAASAQRAAATWY